MSTELVPTSLVGLANRAILAEVEARPDIRTAVSLADSVRGIVYQTDADAAAGADQALTLKRAQDALEAARKSVLEGPRAMVDAVNEFCKGLSTSLAAGRQALDSAKLAYDRERERAARAEQERLQREADELAARQQEERRLIAEQTRNAALAGGATQDEAAAAAADAASVIEDVAPFAVPEPVLSTTTRGGAGAQSTRRNPKAAIVDLSKVKLALVDLRQSDAWASFRRAVRMKQAQQPGIGRDKAVVYQGVAYWYEPGVATRSLGS